MSAEHEKDMEGADRPPFPTPHQPDVLHPEHTRPPKPATPATVPMPGRQAEGEVSDRPAPEEERSTPR